MEDYLEDNDEITDVEGNKLEVGDEVWYARKCVHTGKPELIKLKITKIDNEKCKVWMGKISTGYCFDQIIKIKC